MLNEAPHTPTNSENLVKIVQ